MDVQEIGRKIHTLPLDDGGAPTDTVAFIKRFQASPVVMDHTIAFWEIVYGIVMTVVFTVRIPRGGVDNRREGVREDDPAHRELRAAVGDRRSHDGIARADGVKEVTAGSGGAAGGVNIDPNRKRCDGESGSASRSSARIGLPAKMTTLP
jgi:hypothetical protein